MLHISSEAMLQLRRARLDRLHGQIVAGWMDRLRSSGARVGPDGRAAILAEVDELALGDPALAEDDLVLLADVMLVQRATEARAK